MLAFGLFRLALVILLAGAIPETSIAQVAPERDNAREFRILEQYLKSRKLNRLRVRHAEIELSRELNRDRRRALVAHLAKLYEQHLLSQQSTSADPQLTSRAENLMRQYPANASLNLRLAIEHAHYLDAEHRFHAWWNDGRKPAGRADLIDRFFDLERNVNDLQQFRVKQIR